MLQSITITSWSLTESVFVFYMYKFWLLYIDCVCVVMIVEMKWLLFCALHNNNAVVHVNMNIMTRYQIEIVEESSFDHCLTDITLKWSL